MERTAGEDIINLHFVFRDSGSCALALPGNPSALRDRFSGLAFAIFWLSQAEMPGNSKHLSVRSSNRVLSCSYITVRYE